MKFRIRFNNWGKFQVNATKYRTTSWFRLENKLPLNPIWDALTPQGFKLFVFLMAYASQKAHKTGEFQSTYQTIARLSGVPVEEIGNTISILEEHQICTSLAPREHSASDAQATRESGAHEAHKALYIREEKGREDHELFSLRVLEKFPQRADGNNRSRAGGRAVLKLLQEGIEKERLEKAVSHYARAMKNNPMPMQLAKWLESGEWEEWVKAPTGLRAPLGVVPLSAVMGMDGEAPG